MKKLFAIVAVLGMFTFGATQAFAQDVETDPVETETVEQKDDVADNAHRLIIRTHSGRVHPNRPSRKEVHECRITGLCRT